MRILLVVALIVCVGMAGYYFGVNQQVREVSQENNALNPAPSSAPPTTAPTTTTAPEGIDLLLGAWQSVDDERFVRTFARDGTATNSYQGDASATTIGSWTRVTQASEVPFTIQPGIEYVKIAFPEEVLFFSISKLDARVLEMVYLGVGETLRFSRVQ